jgi:O-antigen ligase
MFFAASIGIAREWNDQVVHQIWFPLQNYRSYLYIGFGGLAWVTLLAHSGRMSVRTVSAQGLLLLLIATYAATLQMIHETAAQGALSYLFAGMTILPLLFVIPALIEEEEDCIRILRAIVIAFWVWMAALSLQVLAGFDKILIGLDKRFIGLTGNPQHAAALAAFVAIIAVGLFAAEQRRVWRIAYGATTAVGLILVLWAGSRTGLGMAAIGIAIVMIRRIGLAALFLPFAAVVGLIGLELIRASGTSNIERLASTTNTRAEPWAKLIGSAMESPFIGVGMQELGEIQATENSYLLAIASYGILMLALVVLLVLVSLFLVLKLYRIAPSLGRTGRSLVDLVAGFNAAYFAGAVLEGYILARVGTPLFLMLVMSGIAVRLSQLAREEVLEPHEYESDADYVEPGLLATE